MARRRVSKRDSSMTRTFLVEDGRSIHLQYGAPRCLPVPVSKHTPVLCRARRLIDLARLSMGTVEQGGPDGKESSPEEETTMQATVFDAVSRTWEPSRRGGASSASSAGQWPWVAWRCSRARTDSVRQSAASRPRATRAARSTPRWTPRRRRARARKAKGRARARTGRATATTTRGTATTTRGPATGGTAPPASISRSAAARPRTTGNPVLLRGVNKMSVFDDEDPTGAIAFPEIRKTGANTVRIVWAMATDAQPGGTNPGGHGRADRQCPRQRAGADDRAA